VLQGERERAADNRVLGRFQLTDIRQAPRGEPQVEVTFDIDANGILNVAAKDLATSKEQKITISGTGTLAKDEIDRMVREAQAHADEDKKRREEIEIRNTADSRVYQVEKLLEENRDKISADDDRTVRAAVEEVKKALASGTRATIEAALSGLEKASHRIAEALYQRAGSGRGGGEPGPGAAGPESPGPGPQGPAGGGAGKEGEVIDAEYVDVDESQR
ncbi:MAG TPA: Hsp70 family protein, partial [Candidatus Polarisedimenticolia bacterium]|nr:Hsp70 family protein [Candidatus Polarisedimenticolia bacterium]